MTENRDPALGEYSTIEKGKRKTTRTASNENWK
jgi:hypothetical protein